MMLIFWVLAPCRLVGRGPEGLKMETVCFSETLTSAYESTGARTQKNIIIIVTIVKTSNVTYQNSF
jgi:hypothetical protein